MIQLIASRGRSVLAVHSRCISYRHHGFSKASSRVLERARLILLLCCCVARARRSDKRTGTIGRRKASLDFSLQLVYPSAAALRNLVSPSVDFPLLVLLVYISSSSSLVLSPSPAPFSPTRAPSLSLLFRLRHLFVCLSAFPRSLHHHTQTPTTYRSAGRPISCASCTTNQGPLAWRAPVLRTS